MTGTELIRKASIEELVGHRERALELYRRSAELLIEAMATAAKACPSYSYHTPSRSDFQDLGSLGSKSLEGWMQTVRKSLDRGVWRHCMQATHLDQVMDAAARKQMADQIEKEPPEATADNLTATLLSLVGNSEQIFKRGVVETFKTFDPNRYQRNDAFKLTERVAWANAFSAISGKGSHWQYWNHYAQRDEHLRDVERVFCVMDGKPIPERNGGIVSAISVAQRVDAQKRREVETEFFHCRWYKNGALHIRFKRLDLLARINAIIAEYYGEVLADASPA
jgi:hypothetical protein